MSFPTLEELKQFEIGSNGKFLLRFEDTNFNILKSGIGYVPVSNVTYKYISTDFYEMSINKTSVAMFMDIKYPTSINIEYFEDYKDTFFRALTEWVENTTVFKTGRLPRDLLRDTKKIEVYEYDKGENGTLKIINRDVFRVYPPNELSKTYSQGLSAKTRSLEFNIAGGLDFRAR